MLQNILEKDPLARFLVEQCSLTKPQLDTIFICQTIGKHERKLDTKIELRDSGKVSKGAFITTLRQSQSRMRKSIYNLLILGYLGIIEEGSTDDLARIVSMLRDTPSKGLQDDQTHMIISGIQNIVEKIIVTD